MSSLEVFEHIRPGGGFVRNESSDSFAWDDPPSEEVRLDPRFHRTADPATELIERSQLGRDVTEEDLLAGPPPHPDEVTHPPTIDLSVPVPTAAPAARAPTVGALPPPSLDRALPLPISVASPSAGRQTADAATVKITRDQLLQDPGPEITVPSPIPPAWPETSDRVVESTMPAPPAIAPDEVEYDSAPARPATPRPVERVAEPVSDRRPRSDTPRTAARRVAAPDEGARLSPVVGLVALLGSGGVLAFSAALAVLLLGLALYLAVSRGEETEPPPTLPPIEVTEPPVEGPAPDVPAPEPAQPVEEAPAPSPSPSPSPSPRPRPKPAPVAPAPAPAPVPVAPPPPRPIPDLDTEDPAPDTDKRGKAGKKKGK
jgi:hypothetical protein